MMKRIVCYQLLRCTSAHQALPAAFASPHTCCQKSRVSTFQKAQHQPNGDKNCRGRSEWFLGIAGCLTLGTGILGIKSFRRPQDSPSIPVPDWISLPTVNAASPVGPGGDGCIGKGGLRERFNFIADVVEKVSPAVVHIISSSFYKQGAGSGFLISDDGLIVTNAHVVQSAREGKVQVELINGQKYKGEVQVVDSNSDLALVKINDTNLPTLKLASSSSLRPGEWVVAVGSPLSLSNTVTSGVISSAGRKLTDLGVSNDIDYIQTDAPITFGNSGGPLINLDGEAVGVNSMKVTDGISFAIPSDYVHHFLHRADEFKKSKGIKQRESQAYIGIETLTLTPRCAAQLRARADLSKLDIDSGVFVVQVIPSSPAQSAGIQKYDVILKINDKNIKTYNDLQSSIRDKAVVKCTVYRQGDLLELQVRPTPNK